MVRICLVKTDFSTNLTFYKTFRLIIQDKIQNNI